MSAAKKSPEGPSAEQVAAWWADYNATDMSRKGAGARKATAANALLEHGFIQPDPEPPPAPKADVIPYAPGNPTRRAVASALREKFKPVPVLRTLSDLKPEVFTWLWKGRIPEDRVTLIQGEPGAGKSTLGSQLTSIVTRGGTWPDGGRYETPGSVLMIQSEEIASKEILDRVESFGGDTTKVHFLDGFIRDGGEMTTVSLAHDVPGIETALDRFGDVRMIIVDPVGEFTSDISGNNEGEVRRVLRPFRDMLERRKIAAVLMSHMNKDDEADITKRGMGSVAFLAISRMAWYLSEDPFDPSRKCLSFLKGNAVNDIIKTGLAYGLDGGKLVWCKEPVRLEAHQVDNALKEFRRSRKVFVQSKGPPPTKTRAAMDAILGSLAKGPQLQSLLIKDTIAAGHSESVVNEALKRLRGDSDDGEDDGGDVLVVREQRKTAKGKRSKQFWLRLATPPAPSLLPDLMSAVDPLEAWMDDGGAVSAEYAGKGGVSPPPVLSANEVNPR